MRLGTIFAGLFFASALAARLAFAQTYLADLPDVPLMPGLREIEGLVFDGAEGRIVETYATGQVGRDAAIAFYRRVLPPLGWTERGRLRFRRGGEELALELLDGGDVVTIRFLLSPG